jgi:hypothetical protein
MYSIFPTINILAASSGGATFLRTALFCGLYRPKLSLQASTRIAVLIRQRHGVEYHPGHVWHLLDRLGFSCQRPTRRALERNQAEIGRWQRHRWPWLKKKPAAKAARFSS